MNKRSWRQTFKSYSFFWHVCVVSVIMHGVLTDSLLIQLLLDGTLLLVVRLCDVALKYLFGRVATECNFNLYQKYDNEFVPPIAHFSTKGKRS